MEQYNFILKLISEKRKCLAILVDPDKFNVAETAYFLKRIPKQTTHIFVGGSTVVNGETEATVKVLKATTDVPIILFPGDYSQITSEADALLFLSLISGRNPEYLIAQQVKSVAKLKGTQLEVIPTAYLLIDGGNESAVARVTETEPLDQKDTQVIVDTAKAGEFMGAKLVYLEAGSGAIYPVNPSIIKEVKRKIDIPVIVGGGIRNTKQLEAAYTAGADIVVMGTLFEE